MPNFNPNEIQAEEGIPEEIGAMVYEEGYDKGFGEGYELALRDMGTVQKIEEV